MNAYVLLIGTSIIKDIDTQRMSNETIVKKHVLKQKTIEGALKSISNLEGNIKTFLLQIGFQRFGTGLINQHIPWQ